MLRPLAITFALSTLALAQPTTYTVTGPAYATVTNFAAAPCPNANCANFTTAMSFSGTFTTPAPLASNLGSTPITVTSFSFTDGLTTYASTDSNVAVNPGLNFLAQTDSIGILVNLNVGLSRWVTTPGVGNAVDILLIGGGPAIHNTTCNTTAAAFVVGATNGTACTAPSFPDPASASRASLSPGGGASYTTPQSVTFATPAQQTVGTPLTLSATAIPSGRTSAITYASSTSAVCTVSGKIVTFLSAGTCSITANLAGSVGLGISAATPVAQSFQVVGGAVGTPTLSAWSMVALTGILLAFAMRKLQKA